MTSEGSPISGAGPEIDVIGDGYCWLWALGASLGILGCATKPLQEDYVWAKKLLLGAQAHVRDGGLSPELHAQLRAMKAKDESRQASEEGDAIRKFMAIEPALRGVPLSEKNYSGDSAGYPVMASYMQIPILCLRKPTLDAEFVDTRGRREEKTRPDTRMGEFALYMPDAQYEQCLSLLGLKQLLQEPDQNLIIVAHNGHSGLAGHFTAFGAKVTQAATLKYDSMSLSEVRAELQQRARDTSGDFEVLMKRFKKAEIERETEEMRLGELRAQLQQRELDASGDYEVLMERCKKAEIELKTVGADRSEEGSSAERASDSKAESSSDNKEKKTAEVSVKNEGVEKAAGHAASLASVVQAMTEAAAKGWPGGCADTAELALQMSAELTSLTAGEAELESYAQAATAVAALANVAVEAEKRSGQEGAAPALALSLKAAAAAVANAAVEAEKRSVQAAPARALIASCEELAKLAEQAQEQAKTEGDKDGRTETKVSVRRPLTEAELRDQGRWRWKCTEGGGWEVWTREADGVWRQRFEVRESGLMCAAIEQNPAYGAEPALGLYAARDLEEGEEVGVLVGEDIGPAEGEEANRAIFDRIAQGRGRHIVEVRRGGVARLLDAEGSAGYTGMQYVNDARRVRGWRNNMGFGEEGIVTALQRICAGTELLFAYDEGGQGGYWKTWGKKGKKTRASTKQPVKQASSQAEQELAPLSKTQKRNREDWALARSLAVAPRCVVMNCLHHQPAAARYQTHLAARCVHVTRISAPCMYRTHISARSIQHTHIPAHSIHRTRISARSIYQTQISAHSIH